MSDLLFHGTYAQSIDQLKPSEQGFFGRGVYLSTCPQDASQYGDRLALVSIQVKRPFHTVADYAVADAYDCDTPAGPMILELLGHDEAAALLIELSHTENGYLNEAWTAKLQAMGHDSICVRWPDGLQHWVVFSPEEVRVESWAQECLQGSVESMGGAVS
jgi:hypothetical protein